MLIHAPYGGKVLEVLDSKVGHTQRADVTCLLGLHECAPCTEAVPVGQYEIHPWCPREDIAEWLRKREIIVEAYSPLDSSNSSRCWIAKLDTPNERT
jgi:hypothetical protein